MDLPPTQSEEDDIMDLIVSIKNDTDYTPYLSNVQLAGANWLPTQTLSLNQPIPNHGQVAGMLSGAVGFQGSITVHFSFVGRGPGGADVVFTFNSLQLNRGGPPAIGFNEQVNPATALTGTTSTASKLDGVDVVLLHIEE
jgi:hypothetical protein